MIKKWIFLVSACCNFFPVISNALIFNLPPNEDLVGEVRIIASQPKDNLHQLARQYEMGFDEVSQVNKKVKKFGPIKAYTPIIIPSFFILPKIAKKGIVINLAEKRLYYYPQEIPIVYTEPVTIGQDGWPTPEMLTQIVEKIKDPPWIVPKSIQQEQREKGEKPKTIIPPGPDNPLGQYALRLGAWSILIHGTNNPYSIGKNASHGCIRMYPEDIAELFERVSIGTRVYIIDQPFKIGLKNNILFLEVHTSLEKQTSVKDRVKQVYDMIIDATRQSKITINWTAVKRALISQDGLPHPISR